MRKQGFLLTFLFFLFVLAGCKKNDPVPTASFTFNTTVNYIAPCTVSFTNQSENAFSYEWTFSDGDSVSTDTNAVHTFLYAGNFDVKLRAFTPSRKEWASQVKTIRILHAPK
jgi:hypothetical protein